MNLLEEIRRLVHRKKIYGGESYFPAKCNRGIKRGYQIKLPVVDWGENEIAIEIHCDAGGNIDRNGQPGSNRHFWFPRKQITEITKNVGYRHGIAVSWAGNKIPRVSASSYAGGPRRYFMVSTWLGC